MVKPEDYLEAFFRKGFVKALLESENPMEGTPMEGVFLLNSLDMLEKTLIKSMSYFSKEEVIEIIKNTKEELKKDML